MAEVKINYVMTKESDSASWYIAGFKDAKGLFLGKGYINSRLGDRYGKIFEGLPHMIKPDTAEQFIMMHPQIGKNASRAYMDFLNPFGFPKYENKVMGSLWSALALFKEKFGYDPEWLLVFSVENVLEPLEL